MTLVLKDFSLLTELFYFFPGTAALPAKPDIVFGSRNTQVGNSYQAGALPSPNSTEAVKYVFGSETNQTDNRYVTFGKVGKTEIHLPNWFPSENEQPQTVAGLINGPTSQANLMSLERHRFVQERINGLKKASGDLDRMLQPLIYGTQNAGKTEDKTGISKSERAKVIRILLDILAVESRLQGQQKLLDNFNTVRPWSLPKHDYFDRDLDSLSLEIDILKLTSLSYSQPASQVLILL